MANPRSQTRQSPTLSSQEPRDAPAKGSSEDDDLPFEEERGYTRKCTQPVLQKLGLSWEANLQEVYPIAGTSIWSFMKEVAFHHKYTMVTSVSDCNQIRHAVELSLDRWPVFRSIVAEYSEDLRLLVALRADRAYFDRAVSSQSEVESVKALRELPIQRSTHVGGELPDGLSCHIVIARVKSTGTVGLLFCGHHAVYDNDTLQYWSKDLERIINGDLTGVLTPYKMFANMYYLYQDSKPARQARDYHKRHLQHGISLDALWPPGKDLLSWYGSTARQSSSPASSGLKRSLNDPGKVNPSMNVAGLAERVRHCPNMAMAYSARGVRTSIAVKMAVCLFNYRKTGHVHAVLTMLLAGRIWPFMDPDIAACLPDINTIAGPTLVYMANVTRIDPNEQVRQLYARMTVEQQDFNRHQHVPQNMIPQLNQESQGTRMQAVRQIFNWQSRGIPDGGDDGTSSEREHGLREVRIPAHENAAPIGVSWNCRLVGHDSLNVRLRYNLRMFSEEQAMGFVDTVLGIVEWVCDAGHWESRIGDFSKAFENVEKSSRSSHPRHGGWRI